MERSHQPLVSGSGRGCGFDSCTISYTPRGLQVLHVALMLPSFCRYSPFPIYNNHSNNYDGKGDSDDDDDNGGDNNDDDVGDKYDNDNDNRITTIKKKEISMLILITI